MPRTPGTPAEQLAQLVSRARINGRDVDCDGRGRQVWRDRAPDAQHVLRQRQAGDHDVGVVHRVFGRGGSDRADFDAGLDRRGVGVVDADGEIAGREASSDRATHLSRPDETDLLPRHGELLGEDRSGHLIISERGLTTGDRVNAIPRLVSLQGRRVRPDVARDCVDQVD